MSEYNRLPYKSVEDIIFQSIKIFNEKGEEELIKYLSHLKRIGRILDFMIQLTVFGWTLWFLTREEEVVEIIAPLPPELLTMKEVESYEN